jgi:hypothetical protein
MVHPSSSASSLSYARVDSPLSKGHPRVFVVRSRHLHCIHKDAQPHFKSVVQRQSMWWIYLSMYKMTSSLMHSVLCLVRWSSPLIMVFYSFDYMSCSNVLSFCASASAQGTDRPRSPAPDSLNLLGCDWISRVAIFVAVALDCEEVE